MIYFICTTVVIVALFGFFNYWILRFKRYRDINKLPGPSAFEIIWQTIKGGKVEDKYAYRSNLTKKYGSVLKLWIKPFDPVIMVADLEYIDKILMSKVHMEKSKLFSLMKPYIGDGLGTTNNVEVWKKDRKMCNVAFQPSIVTGFLPIFAKHAHILLNILKNQNGKPVDMQQLLHFYTLDIIFETMTKENQSFQENRDCAYLNARHEFFKVITERIYSIIFKNDFLFRFSSLYRRTSKAVDVMKKYTRNVITAQKAKMENNIDNSKLIYLIDILFAHKLEEEILNDQINTFILAGHDTVGQVIAFTLYQLSKYPEVQKRLYEEITTLLGEDKDTEINAVDLQEMKYLDAVIRETMRMFTTAPIIERMLGQDMKINDINYPKGTVFILHLDGVHKSEKYFKNAKDFNPDRFLPENSHLIKKNSFLGFSTGPRDCIGKQFAMLEVQFSVAKIVQTFELKFVQDHELKLVNDILIASNSGIPVILVERSV